MRSAAGTQRIEVVVQTYVAGTELGLDLTNDDGVACVASISPFGAIARDGQLQVGDIVRSVNGEVLFTCEAVVSTIKRARGTPLTLGAVRPPEVQVWRDDALALQAGSHSSIHFEVAPPGACLVFRWQVAARARV